MKTPLCASGPVLSSRASRTASPLAARHPSWLPSLTILTSVFVILCTPPAPAAEDLSATLQRGLFEEEANHNLDAAIKAYESVVNATDAQRKLAGTALFRLAECYRKLGRTNDATAHYQRVLREYPDQSRLVDLSREYLVNSAPAALGAARDSERARLLEHALNDAQSDAIRLGALYRQLTNLSRVELRKSLPTAAPDSQLNTLQDQRAKSEQRLAELGPQIGRDHPDMKSATSVLQAINRQIDDRIDGILDGLKLRLQSQQTQVAQLQKELDDARTALPSGAVPSGSLSDSREQFLARMRAITGDTNASAASGTFAEQLNQIVARAAGASGLPAKPTSADEAMEDAEIRSIQSLAKDSPDLINARSHSAYITDGSQTGVMPVSGLTLLHKAAAQGQIKLAEFLLANGADVNAASAIPGTTSSGPAPLSLAARAGRKTMVELLLAKGARVQGNTPFTPLHEAASKGFKSIVETLLDAKADVNAEDAFQSTPLQEAAARGFPGVAQVLITRGANVNALYRARSGAEQLPNNGPSLHFVGSALHQACLRGDKAMVDLLLTNKGNPNLRSYYGLTPLHVAACYGQIPVAASLLAAGADLNANAAEAATGKANLWAPLHFAIQANRPETIRFLLEQGADPNRKFDTYRGQLGYTALHQLLADRPKDFMAMIELLFQHKANPNLTNDNGYGPVSFALRSGDKEVLELLLNHGADPNLRDREGKTPLNQWETPREIWEALLAHKADPNTQDKTGDTPLHRLAQGGRQIRQPGLQGNTPGPNSPAALAELLFAHGADANLRNASGYTALNTFGVPASANTSDGVAFISVLRQHGAKDELTEPGPNPDSIRVWRKGRPSARVVFVTDAGGRNRFTLFETILNFYKLTKIPPSRVDTSPPRTAPAAAMQLPAGGLPARINTATGQPLPPGPIPSRLTSGGNFSPVEDLPFPDFTRVRVQRLVNAEASQKKVFEYNLLNPQGMFDCAKDQLLEFGDVVILPEREFSLNEGRVGLTEPQEASLRNCLRCRVTFIVKGEPKELDLGPSGYSYWFGRLLQESNVRSVLRSSSDLARLTLRRADPGTKQPVEFKVDASDPARRALLPEDDLWLRDGDVIEVPEK